MVGVMAQKKRAAVRKLIRVDEEILLLSEEGGTEGVTCI